jgi:lipoprotein-anchoring transpeptidase ErfK/SrfK
MRLAAILLLCAVTLAIGLTGRASEARAQAGWAGSTPVFQSDVDARQREIEARRAERRKTYENVSYPKYMDGGDKPDIAPEAPPVVYLDANEQPGTIIVDTEGRALYYVLPGQKAYAYPISVGRVGFTWTGTERISRIASWPSWTPPPEMRQRQPGLPITVSGGVINPLGAKALYLGNTIYRIHGTNNERSIGRASSSGCFRMMNQHVVHLASLARVGTRVRVVSSYSGVSPSAPLSSLFAGFSFWTAEAPKATSAKRARKKN